MEGSGSGWPKNLESYGIWIHNAGIITAVLYLFVSLTTAFQNMLRCFFDPPRFFRSMCFFLGGVGAALFFCDKLMGSHIAAMNLQYLEERYYCMSPGRFLCFSICEDSKEPFVAMLAMGMDMDKSG